MWRWFSWYASRFLRKHFHAVRLLRGGEPPAVPLDQPLVVYCNHPSWWDPMIGIFLASRFWPERNHYWPIDAAMLRKYPMFAKLGFFGIEKDSPRGGAAFLRTATAALREGRACLWVTAQGEFADVRQRPVRIKPGLAHLARRLERGTILPLAGEYPFWTERTPEALLRFGRPLDAAARPSHDELERTLADAMVALAAAAIAREPARFTRLLGGAAATGAVYDAWRRARAFATRQRFDAAHADETGADVTPASRPERA
jgi:1-acyl-sn-glycerol-3-phosphate acyltransferase